MPLFRKVAQNRNGLTKACAPVRPPRARSISYAHMKTFIYADQRLCAHLFEEVGMRREMVAQNRNGLTKAFAPVRPPRARSISYTHMKTFIHAHQRLCAHLFEEVGHEAGDGGAKSERTNQGLTAIRPPRARSISHAPDLYNQVTIR